MLDTLNDVDLSNLFIPQRWRTKWPTKINTKHSKVTHGSKI